MQSALSSNTRSGTLLCWHYHILLLLTFYFASWVRKLKNSALIDTVNGKGIWSVNKPVRLLLWFSLMRNKVMRTVAIWVQL